MYHQENNPSLGSDTQDPDLRSLQSPGRSLQFQKILNKAQQEFANIGVEVDGLHYRFAREQKGPGDGLFLTFDGRTADREFYGTEYSNELRSFSLRFIYQQLFDTVQHEFPGTPIWLDSIISLDKTSLRATPSPLHSFSNRYGFVDVTADNSVEYIRLQDAIRTGEIEPGSCLEEYCARYGDDMLLKHGGHYISPDPITLEMLEAIACTRDIKTALEIGSGVGLSGKAAAAHGIDDYHFVDLNPDVVKYLEQHYPGRVTHKNALDYTIERDFDLVQVGIPYELMPEFLSKQGARLADHCDLVVFQSACLTFFEFEHAWLMGDDRIKSWPWFKEEHTLGHYFPHVLEASHGFQSCIVASKTPLDDIQTSMQARGFLDHSFKKASA